MLQQSTMFHYHRDSLKLSQVVVDFDWCDVYIHRSATASVFHLPFCLWSANMFLEQLKSSSRDQWCSSSVHLHTASFYFLVLITIFPLPIAINPLLCSYHNILTSEALQQDVHYHIDQSEASELRRHRRSNNTVAGVEFVGAELCWDHLLHFTTNSWQLFHWWLHPVCA